MQIQDSLEQAVRHLRVLTPTHDTSETAQTLRRAITAMEAAGCELRRLNMALLRIDHHVYDARHG